MGNLQNAGLISMENSMKIRMMIWGYPYFRKPPYFRIFKGIGICSIFFIAGTKSPEDRPKRPRRVCRSEVIWSLLMGQRGAVHSATR